MIVKIIKNGETSIIETNAPTNLLDEHISNEYLCKTELKEYLEELGYEYKIFKACMTLDYDY